MNPSSHQFELSRGATERRGRGRYRYTVAMYRYNGVLSLFSDTPKGYNRDPHRFIAPIQRSIATVLRCGAGPKSSNATVEADNDRRGGYSATRNDCFEAVDRARGAGEAP